MSRAGAVAVLIANADRLRHDHREAETSSARTALQTQVDHLRQLILDVRAGRVDRVHSDRIEIIVKD